MGEGHPDGELIDYAAMDEIRLVNRLEQQLRDALFARSTAHLGEERILRNAFAKFDKDCSGHVDFKEFLLALEYLGLHTEETGLEGHGGLKMGTVAGLFNKYDEDRSGSLEYTEFAAAMMRDDSEHKML